MQNIRRHGTVHDNGFVADAAATEAEKARSEGMERSWCYRHVFSDCVLYVLSLVLCYSAMHLLLFIRQAKTSTGTPSDACMVFYPRSWKQLWETPSDQMWHLLRRGISRFARMHMHRMSSLSCMCNALIDRLITDLYMRYIHMYVSAGVLSTLGDIFICMLQPIY